MRVSHLIVKNWRNFQSIDIDLGNRIFIIGPNASGKSNFLDIFRFLRDIAKPGGGLQKSVKDRGGTSQIRCLAARKNPLIEIQVHLNDPGQNIKWNYAIGLKQEPRGHRQPILAYEKVLKNNSLLLERPDNDDKFDPLRLTQTHLEQINANVEFRDIASFFSSTIYLHLIPQLLRYPEKFSASFSSDDPFGINFLEKVARTPKNTRRARLKKIEAALQIAVPQLKQLTDVKDERGIPHLQAIYEHWRPTGAYQREDQFSDGTLRLIGLLWSLLESDTLLLLEEPELSLNAGIVSAIPPLMHRLQRKKKRQIIISTHSVDLLSDSGIGAEEVILLTPNPEGTIVELASSLNAIKDLLEGGLSIGEAIFPRTVPTNISQLELFE